MRAISLDGIPTTALNETPIQAQHDDIRRRLARLGLTVTERQVKAIAYLERNGQTFGGEFGIDNAVRLATQLRLDNIARARRMLCR